MSARRWRGTGWYVSPNSATEVMAMIARVSTHSTNHRFAWRGLASADFTLSSSLHRHLADEGRVVTEDSLLEREEQILREARRWGLGVEGGQFVDDLQLLADLQHFRVPTRLIDVTSNPMTALWFATAALSHDESGLARSGLLIAINMSWYRREATSESQPQTVFRTVGAPGQPLDKMRRQGLDLDTPFIVSSSLPNPRLRAQEGYFLASSHPARGELMASLKIDVPPPPAEPLVETLNRERGRGYPMNLPFVAIMISPQFKAKLRRYLKQTYSRTERNLFPDFTGFYDHGAWR
ncbi:FRG domain-containing protein [Microbacterium halotolerans]|uniref:FRG domain-containing protein n=1 Tax=Microbacterium halotolerans TaxID=246613 RepID=UPI000E6A9F31|nr:FRG domain-containing protein [Microbacterium halotolerans]